MSLILTSVEQVINNQQLLITDQQSQMNNLQVEIDNLTQLILDLEECACSEEVDVNRSNTAILY